MAVSIVTPEFRISFPYLDKPKLNTLNNKMEYSLDMIFDAKTDLKPLKDAVEAVAKEKFGDKLAELRKPKDGSPSKFKMPWKKGDSKENPEYKGCIYATAKTQQAPGLVDRNKQPIISTQVAADGIYGGCYARAFISVFAFDNAGNKGVSFGLNHVQKLRDGDPFGNRKSVETAFDDLDADDASNYTQEANADLFS